MPHPKNSNLFRLFLGEAFSRYPAQGPNKAFLALFIYGLLCRIHKQQSLPLFSGVASGKLHLLAIIQGSTGILCRIKETAVPTAVSWRGVLQIRKQLHRIVATKLNRYRYRRTG